MTGQYHRGKFYRVLSWNLAANTFLERAICPDDEKSSQDWQEKALNFWLPERIPSVPMETESSTKAMAIQGFVPEQETDE